MGFNCCDFTVLPALTLQVVQGSGVSLVAKVMLLVTCYKEAQLSAWLCYSKGCKGLKSNS